MPPASSRPLSGGNNPVKIGAGATCGAIVPDATEPMDASENNRLPKPCPIESIPDPDPADRAWLNDLDGDDDGDLDDDSTELRGVDLIRDLLPDAVLLKIAPGEKRPLGNAWQKLSLADMTPAYLAGLDGHNVGVLLGPASNHLNSIDIDDDAFVEPFLELNPRLRDTLTTRRCRGCNVWVTIVGDYPKLAKIKTADGKDWGEWRSTGGQTMIHGEVIDPSKGETVPTGYKILNAVKPLQVRFEDLAWPAGLKLPWRETTTSASTTTSTPISTGNPVGEAVMDDIILLPGGQVSITDCAENLFKKIAPTQTLFFRGGAVVEAVDRGDGLLGLELVKPAGFRSRIEMFGQLMAWRSGANGEAVLKPVNCPEEAAKALLETRAVREYLPSIATVINSPIMVEGENELRILPRGYHSENGGILVSNGMAPPEIPVEEAVHALKEILADFDFQTDGDRSRALANLITPALKLGGFIRGFVPADVAEADQSQSGKTFRQRLTCAIYGERPRVVARRDGGVGSMDESFSQALITGCPFIQFDNLRGKFDSQFVESFMTATGGFAARVPHRGEILVDPSRVFLLLTSNGVETTRDMANRSCVVRIRKRTGYTFQTFPEGNVFDHVTARQPYFLGCVFSIIRDWVERGKLRTAETGHDFREWVQILDWIVQNILGAAPLLEGHQRAQQRISDPALTFLRLVAMGVRAGQRMEQNLTAGDIVDVCEEEGIEIPGLRSGAPGDASRKIGVLMRRAFSQGDTVAVDEFTVTRTVGQQARPDGGSYATKAYQFRQ